MRVLYDYACVQDGCAAGYRVATPPHRHPVCPQCCRVGIFFQWWQFKDDGTAVGDQPKSPAEWIAEHNNPPKPPLPENVVRGPWEGS